MIAKRNDALAAANARADAAEAELARVRARVGRLAARLLAQQMARGRAVPAPRRAEAENVWEEDE